MIMSLAEKAWNNVRAKVCEPFFSMRGCLVFRFLRKTDLLGETFKFCVLRKPDDSKLSAPLYLAK